jgi:hypothetical protein
VGFNPTISAGERPQTHDRAATGAGRLSYFRQIATSMHIFNRYYLEVSALLCLHQIMIINTKSRNGSTSAVFIT